VALQLLIFQSGRALPRDPLGEVLFFLIPVLGLVLVAQSVINFGRLVLDKSGRPQAWQVSLASTYRHHVIVCGLGRVGIRVASQLLASRYDVVVAQREWDGEFVANALELKIPVVTGDGRDPEVLRRAGVARARAVVAVVDEDLTNIEIALAARKAHRGIQTVLRIFNEDLDCNLERTFGADSAFSTSALGAPTFAAAAVSRQIEYVLPVGNRLLGVSRVTARENSDLVGPVAEVEKRTGARILLRQDTNGHEPRRPLATPIAAGERLTVLGSRNVLERVRNMEGTAALGAMRPDSPPRADAPGIVVGTVAGAEPDQGPNGGHDTVIVCGLGKVGYRVVTLLSALEPRPRIVVIQDGDEVSPFAKKVSGLEGVTLVRGDIRDREVLESSGLDRAYSVAALTSNDLVNLQVGLAARRARPDVHVVLRVFSMALAEELAHLFGIHTTYSTSELAGQTLAAAAILPGIERGFFVGNRLLAVCRVTVGPENALAGLRVGDLRERFNVLTIGLERKNQTHVLPNWEEVVAAADILTLLGPLDALGRVRARAIG
jgi:Trk K+ transport system NAD-binding subunit